MADMNVNQLIEEMEVFVENCKPAGMLGGGNMVKVNRDELLAMIDELRLQLPKELSESKRIIENRESIIEEANRKAQNKMQDAAREAGALIDNQEVVAMAQMRATEIYENARHECAEMIKKAKAEARAIQQGALEYTQGVMEGLDYMYSTMVDQERTYFNAVISKLQEEHKKILEDKKEIDMQLSASGRVRSREEFEKLSGQDDE